MEKKELKNLESGIRAVKARIHHLRNQHRDNVGAQFFLNLCAQGTPQIVDFMTRYAEQGVAVELKPNEQTALQQAAESTSMNARISDLGFGRNTRQHLLNRRNLLTLAGASIAGGSAIVWSRSKSAIKETIDELDEQIRLERRRNLMRLQPKSSLNPNLLLHREMKIFLLGAAELTKRDYCRLSVSV